MRVVSGKAKGRRLHAPAGDALRPTSDRVREAMFDMLASMDAVTGSTVADLFAGTGALGVEALSRGAAHAVFVDDDPAALDAIKVNLVSTGLYAWGRLEQSDVLHWIEEAEPVDLAFVDPPYAFSGWPEVLERLRSGLAVLESDRELELPKRWEALRTKRYGGTVVTVVHSSEHPDTPAMKGMP